MGYKKAVTHRRDEISGLHVHDDIQDGTYGAMDLSRRNQARQDSINAAIRADWPKDMTSSVPESSDPTLGNAFSRLPRPSDAVAGSLEHYGSGQSAPPKKGGPVQKPAAKPGIQGAEKSRG